jgi:ATP-dependent protease La (LON) substrate-binding domain/Outer membrane protein beta-barrel domain
MTTAKPRPLLAPGETRAYPVLPLRDIVVFSHMIAPLFVGRKKSILALEEAMRSDTFILLAAQKNASDEDPATEAIYEVGTLSVLQLVEQSVTQGVVSGGDDDEPIQVPVDTPVDIPVNIPFVTASINPVSTQFTSHTTKAGWALGAGAEVRLGGNWTGKIEYLYLDFGKVSTTAGLPTNSTPLAINFNSHVTDHIVRVGVNYKFDPNEIWAN